MDKKEYADNERVVVLNALKEEYNSIHSKKNLLKDHNEILKE